MQKTLRPQAWKLSGGASSNATRREALGPGSLALEHFIDCGPSSLQFFVSHRRMIGSSRRNGILTEMAESNSCL
jgi:hypothetical protein